MPTVREVPPFPEMEKISKINFLNYDSSLVHRDGELYDFRME